MKHVRPLPVLMVANVALAGALALMWFTPGGHVRNAKWVEPEPVKADLTGLLPALAPVVPVDTSRFLAMLERPMFTTTRRPPLPPPPVQPPPPPDYLASARVTGVVRGAGAGYVIIEMNGKQRRVQQNQSLDGWTLRSLNERDVTFSNGDQTRTLVMPRADISKFSGVAPPPPTAAAGRDARGSISVRNPASPGGAAAPDASAAPAPRPPPPRFGP